MLLHPRFIIGFIATFSQLMAGTVVVTSLPDPAHPLSPLTTLDGFPLMVGTSVSVGAFPGMTDDEILDIASGNGFSGISSAFVSFGVPKKIGDGVEGTVGRFEIAIQQALPDLSAPCTGEEISVLINTENGLEFLIVRFKGSTFEVDPDTGLEPLVSLHLGDAKTIVGNRSGTKTLSSSPPPARGSFLSWINAQSAITDPALRLPEKDADGDGRSNFLEYATGGNPGTALDTEPCQVVTDPTGGFWVRFSRTVGIGSQAPEVEASADLISPWLPVGDIPVADPNPPSAVAGVEWLRVRVPEPVSAKGFYRVTAKGNP